MAYCATQPPNSKTLCSTAASQYKLPSTGSTMRSTPFVSPAVTALADVQAWYCAKPVHEEDICKRAELLRKLREPAATSDERKTIMAQLKTLPSASYAVTQAMYADYCKLPKNADSSTCLRIKQTQGSKNMSTWYCGLQTSVDSPWCKRQTLLSKLQKIPSTTSDASLASERKELSRQYSEMMKPSKDGGPSMASKISKEIAEAKKSYCALSANAGTPYCKPHEASKAGALHSTSGLPK